MFKDARKTTIYSTEVAADLLHIGTRTLVNYENGHTLTPPDVVLKMSELYRQPELCARYCAEYCPIGQRHACKPEKKDLARAALSVIKEYNDLLHKKERLIEIAADGQITEDEVDDFFDIVEEYEELGREIMNLKLYALGITEVGRTKHKKNRLREAAV